MAGRVMNVLTSMGFTLAQEQKRQIVLLDAEFDACKAKVHDLTAEVQKLSAEVNPLKQEVERLKRQVEQKPQAANAGVHDLEPAEIEMMKFIGNKRSASSEDIQKGMGLHSVAAEHFLEQLLKAEYLEQHPGYGIASVHYSLSGSGNAYLVKNKLVPLPGAVQQQPDNPKGHRCDHCASTRLRRTGSKPDPIFHGAGIKMAMYSCLDCDKESGFTDDKSSA